MKKNLTWKRRSTFVLAATGSAVGLGNIWKFPYITGENGGGAFVLIYLLCILAIGMPIMIAEVYLGRSGRQSPIGSMNQAIKRAQAHSFWRATGWLGALAGVLILSFYGVIAGWSLDYFVHSAKGILVSGVFDDPAAQFESLLASPARILLWHSIFIAGTLFVLAKGVHRGLESAIQIMMPLLFLMILMLLLYAWWAHGLGQSLAFLFAVDFSKITTTGALTALGHAFFTLSLGMGAIMAYGAYMPEDASIPRTVALIAFLDTLVALVAGTAIFAIVFAQGLSPGSGPGLIFQTLPSAFAALPGGMWLAALFFGLVLIAAWSSAISLAEPMIAWLVELGLSRTKAALSVGLSCWGLGIASALSFNVWAQHTWLDMTFFDAIDRLTASVMLPLGGLMIALFVGWKLPLAELESSIGFKRPWFFKLFLVLVRFISPVLVALVLISELL